MWNKSQGGWHRQSKYPFNKNKVEKQKYHYNIDEYKWFPSSTVERTTSGYCVFVFGVAGVDVVVVRRITATHLYYYIFQFCNIVESRIGLFPNHFMSKHYN